MPRGAVSEFSAPALTLPNYESIKPIKVNVNLVFLRARPRRKFNNSRDKTLPYLWA